MADKAQTRIPGGMHVGRTFEEVWNSCPSYVQKLRMYNDPHVPDEQQFCVPWVRELLLYAETRSGPRSPLASPIKPRSSVASPARAVSAPARMLSVEEVDADNTLLPSGQFAGRTYNDVFVHEPMHLVRIRHDHFPGDEGTEQWLQDFLRYCDKRVLDNRLAWKPHQTRAYTVEMMAARSDVAGLPRDALQLILVHLTSWRDLFHASQVSRDWRAAAKRAVPKLATLRSYAKWGEELVLFGKHRDRTYASVVSLDRDYCDWLLGETGGSAGASGAATKNFLVYFEFTLARERKLKAQSKGKGKGKAAAKKSATKKRSRTWVPYLYYNGWE